MFLNKYIWGGVLFFVCIIFVGGGGGGGGGVLFIGIWCHFWVTTC